MFFFIIIIVIYTLNLEIVSSGEKKNSSGAAINDEALPGIVKHPQVNEIAASRLGDVAC